MSDRLNGKVALITGGTSGIGAETAKLFASEGAKVLIVGRSEETGEILANDLGEQVIYEKVDITKEEEIKGAVESTLQHFDQIDILFNNAGGPVLSLIHI